MERSIISYIGSKLKLYDFLDKTIIKKFDKDDKDMTFIDLCSGTNAVSKFIFEKTKWNIISNDIANYSKILFSQIKVNQITDKELDNIFDNILPLLDNQPLLEGVFFNEFAMDGKPLTINNLTILEKQIYPHSRMFFNSELGQKIDAMRSKLIKLHDNNTITDLEFDICMIFLLKYLDKNANTTSIYGAFLKYDKHPKLKPFINRELMEELIVRQERVEFDKSRKLTCYEEYADQLLDDMVDFKLNKEETVIYIDPPYNTRNYETNYHILEYICNMDFDPIKDIKMNSKTAMPIKRHKNPFASKKGTPVIFKDIIERGLEVSDNIFISYSNEGLLEQEEMENIVKELGGKLQTYVKQHQRYTSGEADGVNTGSKNDVYELIWHIKPDSI